MDHYDESWSIFNLVAAAASAAFVAENNNPHFILPY